MNQGNVGVGVGLIEPLLTHWPYTVPKNPRQVAMKDESHATLAFGKHNHSKTLWGVSGQAA